MELCPTSEFSRLYDLESCVRDGGRGLGVWIGDLVGVWIFVQENEHSDFRGVYGKNLWEGVGYYD